MRGKLRVILRNCLKTYRGDGEPTGAKRAGLLGKPQERACEKCGSARGASPSVADPESSGMRSAFI